MLVHPTIFTCVRYAVCRGALGWAHYPISSLVGGFFFEFNDVIRVGDSFESSFYLKNVFQKKGRTGRLIFCVTETKYWNQYKELVATGGCNNIGIAREVSPEEIAKGEGVRADMIYDLGIYKYSKEEIEKIREQIQNIE